MGRSAVSLFSIANNSTKTLEIKFLGTFLYHFLRPFFATKRVQKHYKQDTFDHTPTNHDKKHDKNPYNWVALARSRRRFTCTG